VILDGSPRSTFNGWMDDIAMWDRSLSADEIAAIHTAGRNGAGAPQVPPVLTPPVESPERRNITIFWDPAFGWS
jgi:hypothetical protein